MKNKNLLIWASDLSPNTGEGILARTFLTEIKKITDYKKIKIKTFERTIHAGKLDINKIKLKEVVKKNIFHKYLGPVYGAIYLLRFSRKYEVMYLNYLPLWNFLIFIILPKKTILGPITGGLYKETGANLNLIIRKYFFPIFYNISKIIIFRKFKKAIFSTEILKPYIKKNKYYLYNFIFILFKIKTHHIKKKYDIIFYNRNHAAKHSDKVKKILIYLSNFCSVCIVGDTFEQGNVKNFGWIKRNKVFELIKESKMAFNSSENSLSIFGIDCFNHGVPVLCDSNLESQIKFKNELYIRLNFNNFQKSCEKILSLLTQKKTKKNLTPWNNIFLKKNKIKNFLFLYLRS